MTTPRTYGSPEAFKTALEQRLKSKGGADLARRRQLLVFGDVLWTVHVALGQVHPVEMTIISAHRSDHTPSDGRRKKHRPAGPER
jgi:hypothetical protein